MKARRQWMSLPPQDSINSDGKSVTIVVDAEALEKLLRAIQCAIEPAVQVCQYDKVIDLISYYKDLEELLLAMKEMEGRTC